MTNLVADLRSGVRDHPGATAISVAGNDTTYAELWALTGRFAGALRERGVEPGTSVALYLPNLPQFVVAFYGVLRAGGVVVPVDPSDASGIRDPLVASDAVAVVTTRDRVPHVEEVHDRTVLRFVVTADGAGQYSTGFSEFLAEGAGSFEYWEVVDRESDDLAVLAFTPGTTGEPKGVELTHENVAAAAGTLPELLPNRLSVNDAALGALPFWRVEGMTTAMNAPLASGLTLYPVREWDASEALGFLEDDVTVFHGTPSMYDDLLAHSEAGDHDLSSLRLAGVLGGEPAAETLQAFESEFDVAVHEGYGLTETAGPTHSNAPSWGRRLGSVGKPVPGVSAKVVDDGFEDVPPVDEGPVEDPQLGEIVVAGPSVASGYHDPPGDAFTEDDGRRWFHTGDAGYRDEDDYYYVIGRVDDVDLGGVQDGAEAGGDDESETPQAATAETETTGAESAGASDGEENSPAEDGEPSDGPTELQDLDGISGSRAASLRDAGFESVADLQAAERDALTDVKGFGDALVERVKEQVEDG